MSSGEGELFRRAVCGVLGLRDPDGTKPGDTPELWRLGEYRATVRAAAADGSTVDVEPEDPRLASAVSRGMQAIPLRQPFPGCTIVPTSGSVVRIGWEAGREDRPYAAVWESGGASKIVIPADLLELAGNDYFLPKWDPFVTAFASFITSVAGLVTPTDLPTAITAIGVIKTAATTLQTALTANSNYKSTKVKNG